MGTLVIFFIIAVVIITFCLTAASKKYDKGEKGLAIYWATLGGFWINIAFDIFKAFFTE